MFKDELIRNNFFLALAIFAVFLLLWANPITLDMLLTHDAQTMLGLIGG